MTESKSVEDLKPGETITDFRGEKHKFVRISQQPGNGSSGKIETNKGVFYPAVFNMEFRQHADKPGPPNGPAGDPDRRRPPKGSNAEKFADAPTAKTKIVKTEDGEYIVQTWDASGKRTPNSDYHTDDKADAEGTAKLMVQGKHGEAFASQSEEEAKRIIKELEAKKAKGGLTVPEQHQLKVAKDTLKMPSAMRGVMGGFSDTQVWSAFSERHAKHAERNQSRI